MRRVLVFLALLATVLGAPAKDGDIFHAYLRENIVESVHPCSNFFRHVCPKTISAQETIAQTLLNIREKYLDIGRERVKKYIAKSLGDDWIPLEKIHADIAKDNYGLQKELTNPQTLIQIHTIQMQNYVTKLSSLLRLSEAIYAVKEMDRAKKSQEKIAKYQERLSKTLRKTRMATPSESEEKSEIGKMIEHLLEEDKAAAYLDVYVNIYKTYANFTVDKDPMGHNVFFESRAHLIPMGNALYKLDAFELSFNKHYEQANFEAEIINGTETVYQALDFLTLAETTHFSPDPVKFAAMVPAVEPHISFLLRQREKTEKERVLEECTTRHTLKMCALVREKECEVTWSTTSAANFHYNQGFERAYSLFRKDIGIEKLNETAYDDLPYTNEQLFFLSHAALFCRDFVDTQTTDNNATPIHARINAAVSLLPAFQKAFNCSKYSFMNQVSDECIVFV